MTRFETFSADCRLIKCSIIKYLKTHLGAVIWVYKVKNYLTVVCFV